MIDMLCLNCPLCVSDYCDACGDGDIYCLITRRYANYEGGCRRTNKFILSQDKLKLINDWQQSEALKWCAYAEAYENEFCEPAFG